jgi:hypothetical protein
MGNLLPVYRRPTQEEFSHMWQEGIFAFDANVLLNIYCYTPETRERFFELLKRLNFQAYINLLLFNLLDPDELKLGLI